MKLKRTTNTIINLCIAAYIISVLAHVMHWYNTRELKLIIALLLSIALIIDFFFSATKSWFQYLILGASIAVFLGAINSLVLKINVLYFLDSYLTISVTFLIVSQGSKFKPNNDKNKSMNSIDTYVFGQEETLQTIEQEQETPKKNFIKIIFYLSGFIIVLGMLFKTLHYPGANLLNIIGFIGATGSLLYLTFSKNK